LAGGNAPHRTTSLASSALAANHLTATAVTAAISAAAAGKTPASASLANRSNSAPSPAISAISIDISTPRSTQPASAESSHRDGSFEPDYYGARLMGIANKVSYLNGIDIIGIHFGSGAATAHSCVDQQRHRSGWHQLRHRQMAKKSRHGTLMSAWIAGSIDAHSALKTRLHQAVIASVIRRCRRFEGIIWQASIASSGIDFGIGYCWNGRRSAAISAGIWHLASGSSVNVGIGFGFDDDQRHQSGRHRQHSGRGSARVVDLGIRHRNRHRSAGFGAGTASKSGGMAAVGGGKTARDRAWTAGEDGGENWVAHLCIDMPGVSPVKELFASQFNCLQGKFGDCRKFGGVLLIRL
jgi:hypothetical protein